MIMTFPSLPLTHTSMNFHPNYQRLPIEFVIDIDCHILLVIEMNNETLLDEIEAINKMMM